MEFSTPATTKGNSLRRRTLMKLVDTPITSEPLNDETERSSRRSIIEIQQKVQEAQSPSLNDSVRFSGEQEIKDHLNVCTKLYAENKITTGMAWQLRIIDLLKVVSRKHGSDPLQVAGTSLDIGAKVYGLRVDDVHAESLKLANSMARFAEKNQAQQQENDDADDNAPRNEDEPRAKRKKKTLRFDGGVKNTIVKDRSSLLAPIPQLESVFFSNRIDNNLSTVDNLFTNSLPMDKTCSKLLALEEVKAWVTGPDESVEGLDGPKNLDIDLLPKDGNICTPFQNFVLDQWNIDEEEQNNVKDDALTNDVVVFDDNGIPLHELDGSIQMDFNDNDVGLNDEDDEPIEENFFAQQIQHEVAHTVDIMKAENTLQRSEYSYNNVITLANGKVIDQIWAGPSHWKLKFLRRSKARFSGAVEAQTVSKPRKRLTTQEPEPLDFTKCEDVREQLDKLKRIKIKKKIYPANKITLPLPDRSSRNMMNDIYELMIKPGTIVTHMKNDTIRTENGEDNFDNAGNLETEDHDMDNDVGCMDPMDEMDHMDQDQGNDIETDEAILRERNFMGDNLVDAPEYAAKIYVPYALQAKKMDMKKLKNYVWQMLSQNTQDSRKIPTTTFATIYSQAKATLPTAMSKELSCSLAFSAILHLCNENTLKLTQVQGCKDFTIESG